MYIDCAMKVDVEETERIFEVYLFIRGIFFIRRIFRKMAKIAKLNPRQIFFFLLSQIKSMAKNRIKKTKFALTMLIFLTEFLSMFIIIFLKKQKLQKNHIRV